MKATEMLFQVFRLRRETWGVRFIDQDNLIGYSFDSARCRTKLRANREFPLFSLVNRNIYPENGSRTLAGVSLKRLNEHLLRPA